MRFFCKFFEILYLNLCLLKVATKSLIIRLKIFRSEFRCRKLLFQRGVLVVSQRDALLEDYREPCSLMSFSRPSSNPMRPP